MSISSRNGCEVEGLSIATPTTPKPLAPCSLVMVSNNGISWRHGLHQVAQKFTRVSLLKFSSTVPTPLSPVLGLLVSSLAVSNADASDTTSGREVFIAMPTTKATSAINDSKTLFWLLTLIWVLVLVRLNRCVENKRV